MIINYQIVCVEVPQLQLAFSKWAVSCRREQSNVRTVLTFTSIRIIFLKMMYAFYNGYYSPSCPC